MSAIKSRFQSLVLKIYQMPNPAHFTVLLLSQKHLTINILIYICFPLKVLIYNYKKTVLVLNITNIIKTDVMLIGKLTSTQTLNFNSNTS